MTGRKKSHRRGTDLELGERDGREAPIMEGHSTSSVLPQRSTALSQISWENLTEPGAYVEIGSGDLYRVPQEALLRGASPVIRKESVGANRLLQLSKDPFITTLEARMLCAEQNIKPNF